MSTGTGAESTKLRIGFFGSFFPEFHRAGNSSTGLVLLLAHSPNVEGIDVFGQAGARLPPVPVPSRLKVEGLWDENDPVSLLKNLLTILGRRASIDCLLTNTYVTAFGRRPSSNLVGLLTPSIFAILTRKPSVVYLHNSSVTQDLEKLGYTPSRLRSWVLRVLEKFLVETTTVIVPLRSQKGSIEEEIGGKTEALVIPYVDCTLSAMLRPEPPMPTTYRSRSDTPVVLLIGTWGPQKDLDGILRFLLSRMEAGRRFRVVVAGEANRNFPEYSNRLSLWKERLPPDSFTFIGRVPEEKVLDVIADADLVVLPYLTTGGYSGVLNSCAMTDTPVVAYDLPQLREFSHLLDTEVVFVDRARSAELAGVLDRFLAAGRKQSPNESSRIREHLLESKRASERLLFVLKGGRA